MTTKHLDKEKILDVLRQNKSFFKHKFDIDNIMLFGSYARDEATKDSDVDIMIESKTRSFDNKYDIKVFLEKKLNKRVEIVYIDSVHPFLMRFISKELIYA